MIQDTPDGPVDLTGLVTTATGTMHGLTGRLATPVLPVQPALGLRADTCGSTPCSNEELINNAWVPCSKNCDSIQGGGLYNVYQPQNISSNSQWSFISVTADVEMDGSGWDQLCLLDDYITEDNGGSTPVSHSPDGDGTWGGSTTIQWSVTVPIAGFANFTVSGSEQAYAGRTHNWIQSDGQTVGSSWDVGNGGNCYNGTVDVSHAAIWRFTSEDLYDAYARWFLQYNKP